MHELIRPIADTEIPNIPGFAAFLESLKDRNDGLEIIFDHQDTPETAAIRMAKKIFPDTDEDKLED